MLSVKVLDCTLRDGGYYNNWDFSEELISCYLDAVAKANIDLVELGLRSFPSSSFKGAHAFTTEKYINDLDLPSGPKYGVMVDAKTIISNGQSLIDSTKKLFVEKSLSKLHFVRVAAHYSEIAEAIEICGILKDLGYFVGLNLMQSAGKPSELISEAGKLATESDKIDVLYFADSLGNMDPYEATRIIDALREHWTLDLGIHAHDNTSRALSNTLHCMCNGVRYLDATITGMGRGAGNTKTEILAFELENSHSIPLNSSALHKLVLQHFEPLQKKCGWGTSFLYHIGAIKSVHPSYIQQLYNDERFGAEERAAAIQYLGGIESSSYDGQKLEHALNIGNQKSSPKQKVGDIIEKTFSERDILLIGAGDSVKTHKKGIIQYIQERNPIVVSININVNIPGIFVDYYAISHNVKYLTDHVKYGDLAGKIIAPESRFEENIDLFKNYELSIGDSWNISQSECEIPFDNTAAYALCMCIAGSAKRIFLVGFDGYTLMDQRNKEVQETLDHMKSIIPISTLTPSNYNIPAGSIYAI